MKNLPAIPAFLLCIYFLFASQLLLSRPLTTQLYLFQPADKEVLETLTPSFAWTALHTPVISSNDGITPQATIRLILVKLLDAQNAVSGITSNIPLFTSYDIFSEQLVYPAVAPTLEEGGRYAWQLQELTKGTVSARSEAWEFKIKAKPKQPLTYELNETGVIYNATLTQGSCHFLFNEKYQRNAITIEVRDEKNHLIQDYTFTNSSGENNAGTGYNNFTFSVNSPNRGSRYKIYIVLNNGMRYTINAFNE